MKLSYLANALCDNFAFKRQEIELVFKSLDKMQEHASQEELDRVFLLISEKLEEMKQVLKKLPALSEVMSTYISATDKKLKGYTDLN